MKGDFSRKTFKKVKNFSGVLKQQGRVSLDAEHNELDDILKHHRRTRTIDIIGKCGAPVHADGFEIRHPGGGPKNLLISTGRFYVDGLLCELHPFTQIPVTFPEGIDNQVEVAELKVDGQEFDKHQWVHIFTDENPEGILALINAVNTSTNTLTFNRNISSLHGGTSPRLRRMIPYSGQQDYQDPADWQPTPRRTYLVYLDVWERHITFIEDEELKEVALGGPDTATRTKIISQVKILGVNRYTECKDVPPFSELFPPSGARLKSQAVGVPEAEDPCLINLDGGYKGVENRLYRVEVHQGGEPYVWPRPAVASVDIAEFPEGEANSIIVSSLDVEGNLLEVGQLVELFTQQTDSAGAPGDLAHITHIEDTTLTLDRDVSHLSGDNSRQLRQVASFKWSRDNGSIAFAVEEFRADATEVKVKSLGRDKVLGLRVGEWVEISDDISDLKGEAGTLAQIVDPINEAEKIIKLSRPISGFSTAARAKVRRWDQKTDTVAVAAGPIDLEDGVQVLFSGSNYRTGDYWMFAARTLTGEVEELDYEPPHGIKHHYCKLAVVAWQDYGKVEIKDCRPPFSPLTEIETIGGCCTEVVHPGDDIQAAINNLPRREGGCVCLKAGIHTITRPIKIHRSNVVLHGESSGTVVERRSGVWALDVRHVSNIKIEGIRFEILGGEAATTELSSVISLQHSERAIVNDCDITVNSALAERVVGIHISPGTNASLTLSGNNVNNVLLGINIYRNGAEAPRIGKALHISKNTITGPVMTVASVGIDIKHVWETCLIEQNHITGFLTGIRVDEDAERPAIVGNTVLRPSIEGSGEQGKFYGIDVEAAYGVIAENYVDLTSTLYVGIRTRGSHTRIEGNRLISTLETEPASEEKPPPLPLGIFVVLENGGTDFPPDHSVVRGNTISGLLDGILIVSEYTDDAEQVAVEGVQVLENQIMSRVYKERQFSPRVAVAILNANDTVIAGNHIRDTELGITLIGGIGNRVLTNNLIGGKTGIEAKDETNLDLFENVVEGMKSHGFSGRTLLGDTTVSHNRFAFCGYEKPAVSVFVSVAESLCIESCQILDTGISPDGENMVKERTFGINVKGAASCQISKNRVANPSIPKREIIQRKKEDRALYLGSPPLALSSAQVVDNVFSGTGFKHLIEFAYSQSVRFSKVIFTNNYCEHYGNVRHITDVRPRPATVSFWGLHLIVIGNHVVGPDIHQERRYNSMTFTAPSAEKEHHIVLMGNITSHKIEVGPTTPSPQADYNIEI